MKIEGSDTKPALEVLEEALFSHYRACELCPRRCKVDRTAGQLGICGEDSGLRVAAIEIHTGEEPPISGREGSGAVFLSGCSLQCLYCQNYQISREGIGRPSHIEEVVGRLEALQAERRFHNVNFVTPDHFLPHTMAIVERLRERGIRIPTVYNLSGYQRVESLRLIESFADIYLPDFKYADRALANDLSGAPDYVVVALEAVSEMVRQKGFLDTFSGQRKDEIGTRGTDVDSLVAQKGVLVRHLILPGHLENSLTALNMLFAEFGPDLPLSLMSQYVPVRPFSGDSPLNRRVTAEEFCGVLDRARDLGFRDLFFQDPEEVLLGNEAFLPDFRSAIPFPGNVKNSDGQSRIPRRAR